MKRYSDRSLTSNEGNCDEDERKSEAKATSDCC